MEDLVQKLVNPIPMGVIRCNLHRPANIQKVCSEISCDKKPLMCSKCLSEDMGLHGEHQSRITDLDSFVNDLTLFIYKIVSFSNEMYKSASQNKLLYSEFLMNKENVEMMNLLQQENHIKNIEDLVTKQKLEISNDLTLLSEKLIEQIQVIKDENFRRLEDFLQQYKNSFHTLKENIDRIFRLSRNNFFYSNTNTLQFKLQSLYTPDAQKLVQTLKSCLHQYKLLAQTTGNSTPLSILTDLQTLARFLQQMSRAPPNYDKMAPERGSKTTGSTMESIVRELGQQLNSIISARLSMPMEGIKETSQVGKGENNLQLQVEARNSDEFHLKPSKKYQLDFPIQCILSISDQLFVLASNDSILRVFDTSLKRIQTYSGHSDQIIYLEKLTKETNIKVIVWTAEENSNTMKVYRKFYFTNVPALILDMKDQSHLAVAHQNREISVCGLQHQKIGTFGKSSHMNRINGLTLLKKGEKFLSYSSDSVICIWRIMKAENQMKEPMIQCTQTLVDPLYGTITQIFISTQWNNQAIIINLEGEIKIFDLVKNCILFSQYGTRKITTEFMESVILEETDRKISPTVWILSFAFSDWALAIEHRLTNSPFTMHSQDVKLEHKLMNQTAGAPKRKVQMFNLSPSSSGAAKLGTMYVMFANEQNQELLVYELKAK